MSVCRSWRLWSRLAASSGLHQPVGSLSGIRAAATAAQEAAGSSVTEADRIKKERKMSSAMQLYLQR